MAPQLHEHQHSCRHSGDKEQSKDQRRSPPVVRSFDDRSGDRAEQDHYSIPDLWAGAPIEQVSGDGLGDAPSTRLEGT
jgi:hypothetical protein